MRAVFGLLLIMLGLALAVVWMPEHNGERQLAVVTEIATQGISRREDRADRADRNGRTFSPQTPLLATVEPSNPRPPQYIAATARLATTSAPVPGPAGPVQTVASAPPAPGGSVIVGTVSGASVVGSASLKYFAPVQVDSAIAARTGAAEVSRFELVRNIQRELKRVGCYWGEVDGDWGTGSRRAMSSFTERVNASLPTDQPDFILLTLLQGHPEAACGKTCPSGQSVSDSGRCLPNAVLAQGRRGSDRRAPSRGEIQQVADTSPQPAAPSGESGWTTRVARAPTTNVDMPGHPAPITGTTAGQIAATVTPIAAAALLPGRMAVGGPRGGGGFVTAPAESQAAGIAVRQALPEAIDPRSRAASRKDRSRRAAAGRDGPAYRYGYPPPVNAYRARRGSGPSVFASAPRRGPRSWTGTFFSSN